MSKLDIFLRQCDFFLRCSYFPTPGDRGTHQCTYEDGRDNQFDHDICVFSNIQKKGMNEITLCLPRKIDSSCCWVSSDGTATDAGTVRKNRNTPKLYVCINISTHPDNGIRISKRKIETTLTNMSRSFWTDFNCCTSQHGRIISCIIIEVREF